MAICKVDFRAGSVALLLSGLLAPILTAGGGVTEYRFGRNGIPGGFKTHWTVVSRSRLHCAAMCRQTDYRCIRFDYSPDNGCTLYEIAPENEPLITESPE